MNHNEWNGERETDIFLYPINNLCPVTRVNIEFKI